MNTASWTLYFINTISNFQLLCLIALVAVSLVSIVTLINHGIEENELHPKWWVFGLILLVLGFFLVFTPDRTTMYMIVASQLGEQILQLEQVQAIGGEAADLARVTIEALRAQIAASIPPLE